MKSDVKLAYIHGYLKAQIDQFAASTNTHPVELTQALAELLAGEAVYPMSDLPRKTTRPNSIPQKVEVARNSHPHGAQSKAKRNKKVSRPKVSQKLGGWDKFDTPRKRKNEFFRRQAKWSKEAIAKWRHKAA